MFLFHPPLVAYVTLTLKERKKKIGSTKRKFALRRGERERERSEEMRKINKRVESTLDI